MSRSLRLARSFLAQSVRVIIDRSPGSRGPRHGFLYPVNYGYLPGTLAPDGEALDAYVLGVTGPLETFSGVAVAIVHRADDDDDKLVVVSAGLTLTDAQIMSEVAFQEQFFKSSVVRALGTQVCGRRFTDTGMSAHSGTEPRCYLAPSPCAQRERCRAQGPVK